MKTFPHLLAATLLLGSPLHAKAPAGKAIAHEDFSKADATATWRWGVGKWTVADGVLKGSETAERKHPAGIACQRDYHEAGLPLQRQGTPPREKRVWHSPAPV